MTVNLKLPLYAETAEFERGGYPSLERLWIVNLKETIADLEGVHEFHWMAGMASKRNENLEKWGGIEV